MIFYLTKMLLLIFLIVIPCTMFGQQNQLNKISFVQGDSVFNTTSKTSTVYLERKPFSIRFFNKKYDSNNSLFYAMRVAIVSNPKDTLIVKKIKKIDDIPFFEPGSGVATGENNMYDQIYIKNNGNHYLTYENESDKNVYRISEENNLLQLEWKILAVNYEDKDIPFNKLSLKTLYFILLNDINLNGNIEEDELKIIITKFK